MKPGLEPGYRESISIVITEEMAAAFAGQMVHPVLSTVHMVYYMEWVSRQVILPFLEEGEEGMGTTIQIRHKAPAPIGKQVTFTATVTERTASRVVCQVRAEHDRSVVGEGEFVQVILPLEKIQANIARMK